VALQALLIRKAILLAAGTGLLAGCRGTVSPPPVPPAPSVTANADPAPSATPFPPLPGTPLPGPALSPTPPPPFDPLPRYTFNVVLDYGGHSLSVDEAIRYPNPGPDSLSGLVLAVEAARWTDGFVLRWVMADGLVVSGSQLSGARLEVPLAAPLAPGASANLSLHYELHLPQADSKHVFGYNARQANLVDWYPFVVPYIPGQGWLLHTPEPFGEYLVYDTAAFDITLRLADPGQPVVVAASASLEKTDEGWHASVGRARTFTFSASPEYLSASALARGVTVTSYFFAGEQNAAQALLQAVAEAVATFTDKFGALENPNLSVVEAVFNDGLETDGLFFLSRNFYTRYDGTALNYLIAIGVHETAHLWWFARVGNDQALEPWLDEALATYSECVFYQVNHPEVSGWWQFRVDVYAPTGWVDTDIYHAAGYRTYVNAVYLRGAHFLDALRTRVGDEAFFAFLKDYAVRMAGKRATADDFFRILRQHSAADISDLVRQYFQHPH
jgi:hypothetical protein